MTQRIPNQTTRRVIQAHTFTDEEALAIAGPASCSRHKGHRLQALFIPLESPAPVEDTPAPTPVEGAKAPDRILLFAYGATETTKGTFFLSQDSAAQCLEAEAEYGNDLLIDKDHSSMGWDCDTTAYGWWSQEVDEAGIWAGKPRYNSMELTGIWWLEAGRLLVESYSFRYISPVIWTYYDDQGREVIVEIVNFALTNMPATKNRTPIINSRGGLMPEPRNNPAPPTVTGSLDPRILAAVCALTGQTETEKILGALEALTELKTALLTANTELATTKTKLAAAEKKVRKQELDNLVLEKKLPPHIRKKAEAENWSEEKLAGALETLAGQVPATHTEANSPITNSDNPDAPSQLTAEELAHCEKYSLDPVEYENQKNVLYKGQKVAHSI